MLGLLMLIQHAEHMCVYTYMYNCPLESSAEREVRKQASTHKGRGRFQSDGDGAGYPEQRWGFWALVAQKPIQDLLRAFRV